MSVKESFDRRVRMHVYDHFVGSGRGPTTSETAEALAGTAAEVRAAFRRLAEGKALVLQEGSGEVLMAEPFSAVPTAFLVEIEERRFWGNCIWDALGIPAMLRKPGRVLTSCPDCGDGMVLTIEDGELLDPEGVVHYVVPARDWWKDVVYT